MQWSGGPEQQRLHADGELVHAVRKCDFFWDTGSNLVGHTNIQERHQQERWDKFHTRPYIQKGYSWYCVMVVIYWLYLIFVVICFRSWWSTLACHGFYNLHLLADKSSPLSLVILKTTNKDHLKCPQLSFQVSQQTVDISFPPATPTPAEVRSSLSSDPNFQWNSKIFSPDTPSGCCPSPCPTCCCIGPCLC